MQLIIEMRQNARENKDFATADKIRDKLNKLKIVIKDTSKGAVWEK